MKKIIVPEQREEASYFSDFTGQPFGDLYHPPVTLKLEFNYGSEYDQSEITLHLSDKDIVPILDLISSKLNPDFRKSLEEELIENDEQYFNAIEARDPMECEHRISCNNLLKKLLGHDKLD
jgi:hypothetical protein